MSDEEFTRDRLRKASLAEKLVKGMDISLLSNLVSILTDDKPLEEPFYICKRVVLEDGSYRDTEIVIKKKVQVVKL